jgi:hypothetical protein
MARQLRYNVRRSHRVAASAKVHVARFSAHPLGGDGAALYEPPDGYVGVEWTFIGECNSPNNRPALQIRG